MHPPQSFMAIYLDCPRVLFSVGELLKSDSLPLCRENESSIACIFYDAQDAIYPYRLKKKRGDAYIRHQREPEGGGVPSLRLLCN